MSGRRILIWIAMLCAAASGLHAQATADRATLRARVQVAGAGRSRHKSIPGTVVWLTPIAGGIRSAAAAPMLGASTDAPANPAQIPRLVQKDKSFEPHILVIPAGSVVEFPNRDPFFHNVFSLSFAYSFLSRSSTACDYLKSITPNVPARFPYGPAVKKS
ncbi:MAG: hypothetical protein WBW53_13975 [Terriglobales bacterium]